MIFALMVCWICAIGQSAVGGLVRGEQPAADQYHINIEHWAVADGLPHPTVYSIYQTADGFLWLGTGGGLSRFDGQHFRHYSAPAYNFSSNEITIVKEDQNGLLWLFSALRVQQYDQVKSIDIFDPRTEEVVPFAEYFGDGTPFQLKDIRSLTSLSDRSLVFFTHEGRYIRYTKEVGFESFPFELGDAYRTFDDARFLDTSWGLILRDSINEYFTASLVELDADGQVLREYPTQDTFNHVQWGGTNSKGDVFYADFNHEERWFDDIYYVTDEARSSRMNWLQNIVSPAYLEQSSTLWIDFKLHPQEEVLFCILDEKMYAYHYGEEWVYDLTSEFPDLYKAYYFFYDAEGRLWLGSDHGIYCVKIQKLFYKSFFSDASKDLLGFDIKRVLRKDQTTYAAGYYAGLLIAEDGVETSLSVDEIKRNVVETIAGENGEDPQEMVYEVIADQGGKLWLGMDRVLEQQPNGGWIRHGYDAESGGGCDHINLLFEDKQAQIWYSCDQALGYIGTDGFMHDIAISEQYSALRGASIRQWYLDDDQQLWLVSNAGLFVLDVDEHKIIGHYGTGADDLPVRTLNGICKAANDGFWLTTEGNGLLRWKPGYGLLEEVTQLQGLSTLSLYGIYSDANGALWLSSAVGLIRYDPTARRSYVYRKMDGLSLEEFNPLAHTGTANGGLLFGNRAGVLEVNPASLEVADTTLEARVMLEKLEILHEDASQMLDHTREVLKTGQLDLRPADRLFRLSFVMPTLEAAELCSYAWIIDGLVADWTFQEEAFIQLGNLPYGTYNLRVRGLDAHGRRTTESLELQVISHKPFYLQSWFLILAAIALVLAILGYSWLRTRQLRLRQQELEEQVTERTEQIRKDKELIEAQAEELRSLEQLKLRFFANVSHELRTPLSLLLGPTKRLLSRAYWKQEDRQLLGLVHRNGQQLLRLVNEILDLSKLESGRLDVQPEPTALKAFVNPMLTQFSAYGAEYGQEVILSFLPRTDLQVLLDQGKVEKIITNFLSNASKFTPPGGTIELRVIDLTDRLRFEVHDSGAGIHPDDLPNVFDRFYQSKKTDMPVQGGTGIGLSLCAELAELLNGRVWAESELGVGSIFYFECPKVEVSEPLEVRSLPEVQAPVLNPRIVAEDTTNSAPNQLDKPKVLLVEDNVDLREYLKVLLQAHYQVVTAINGKVAIDYLRTESLPALIITDLMMPIIDGFQLLEWVKSQDSLRHLPFIILTARQDLGVKLRALRVGVDDYLTKPFEEEELLARSKNLLENLEQRLLLAQPNDPEKENGVTEDTPVLSKSDADWLVTVEQVMDSQLADSSLKLDHVAQQLHLSVRQLRRRLKRCTGLSPQKYLREMRLQRARQFLGEGRYSTVKEAAYAVGFLDATYFSNVFEQRFKVKPSAYANG